MFFPLITETFQFSPHLGEPLTCFSPVRWPWLAQGAGRSVMSPRILVQPGGPGICPQPGWGLQYKLCECGSRWENGMRISRTVSEDSRAIWVCSCLYANIILLPKGREVQHFQSILVAAECGLRSCLVPLVGNVCYLCIFSPGPFSRDFPSFRL